MVKLGFRPRSVAPTLSSQPPVCMARPSGEREPSALQEGGEREEGAWCWDPQDCSWGKGGVCGRHCEVRPAFLKVGTRPLKSRDRKSFCLLIIFVSKNINVRLRDLDSFPGRHVCRQFWGEVHGGTPYPPCPHWADCFKVQLLAELADRRVSFYRKRRFIKGLCHWTRPLLSPPPSA